MYYSISADKYDDKSTIPIQLWGPDGKMTPQLNYYRAWAGDLDHRLDKATFREYVTYKPGFGYTDPVTKKTYHQMAHPAGGTNENCFTNVWRDPTINGGPASGSFQDNHARPGNNGLKDSTCTAAQKYQWATGGKNAPDMESSTATWSDLESYPITRRVQFLTNINKWQYSIVKDGTTATYTYP